MDKTEAIREIVRLVRAAQDIASEHSVPNILQPGLVKELIMAAILGHDAITSKRDADACDPGNPDTKFEYLSCYEGGSGQLDRMFKDPPEKRRESLRRISRNKAIYLAIFFKSQPLTVKTIYEISPEDLKQETERQLDRSRNEISHVGFSERWAQANGKVVYRHSGK